MEKTSKSSAPPSSAVRNISRATSEAFGSVSVRTSTSGLSRRKRSRKAWNGAGSPQSGWCLRTTVTGPADGLSRALREQDAQRASATQKARAVAGRGGRSDPQDRCKESHHDREGVSGRTQAQHIRLPSRPAPSARMAYGQPTELIRALSPRARGPA